MGNRVPYAMRTFAGQVLARYPLTEVGYEDADGFGVYRTLTLGGDSVGWFTSVMEVLALDPRIEDWAFGEDRLVIMFVSDRRADDGKPFPLRDIENALTKVDQEDDLRSRLEGSTIPKIKQEYPEFADTPGKKADLIDAIIAAQ